MIRKTLFVLGLMLSLNAFADTGAFFSGNQARVVVQGNVGDMDAPKLFTAMNVAATSDGSQNQKQISFQDHSGQTVFELVCATSQNVANFGSCTLHVTQQANSVFDPAAQKFAIVIQDASDVSNASKLFQKPSANGSIYTSADGKLNISSAHSTFTIQYN